MVSPKGLKPKKHKEKRQARKLMRKERRIKEKKPRSGDWKITSVKGKLSWDPQRLPKARDPRGM